MRVSIELLVRPGGERGEEGVRGTVVSQFTTSSLSGLTLSVILINH